MVEKNQILQVIYDAIDEVNAPLPETRRLEKSPETVLFGQGGQLDSLGLVNLVVITEENVEDAFDVPINIADQRAMSQKNSPFRTVDTLADYIVMLLDENL
ncbi:MAG: hypothetical protein D6768_05095 [Chloroflexi bacterium]|nr:MAG: hypothetical protein D6768_05095 [Chloroflexota bacterium]